MSRLSINPFDLNLARAYSAPESFCPRPELAETLDRAIAGQLWTLIEGDRRMGKSSAVIADCVRRHRPVLHVDLMGIRSEQEIAERYHWAWLIYQQQEASGLFSGLKPELSATIPGTTVGVRLSGKISHPQTPQSWGEVIVAFDHRITKTGGVLFLDEFQDLARLPDEGQNSSRSLRAALQMARHLTPVLAGSSYHLLAGFFSTSASAFFKSIRLQAKLDPLGSDRFGAWAGEIFSKQHRAFENTALARLMEVTAGVTEDLVATCAEIWVQNATGRTITAADVETGWKYVVSNAAHFFLADVSSLTELQAGILRYVARTPMAQPFSRETLAGIGTARGPMHRALARLVDLDLVRVAEHDGRKRVWVHDGRLAFYLRA